MIKKQNHQVNIVKLGEPRVHANADSLELFDIGEYQVVTKKDSFRAGDLGIYLQPDSVVPQTSPFSFIWEAYVGLDGTVPEKRRRITVKKFRGQYSEGLLLPISDFPNLYIFKVGDDVSEFLGINHYDPDKGKESAVDAETFKKRKLPRTLKGWFYFLMFKLFRFRAPGQNEATEDGIDMPIFDVDALKNYKNAFDPDEQVEVTEKIHGSNARFLFRDDHMYAGSREQWKAENAKCIWRSVLKAQPWIEKWCRAHPGYGLYGEVTPQQGVKFEYGSKEPQLFAFDIRTPEGTWVGHNNDDLAPLIDGFQMQWVPLLYEGPYKYIRWDQVEGQTTVRGAKGIREGFVIRPIRERHVRGLGRLILKVVSNAYLERDVRD